MKHPVMAVSVLLVLPLGLALWLLLERTPSSDRRARAVAPSAAKQVSVVRNSPRERLPRTASSRSPVLDGDNTDGDSENLSALRRLALSNPARTLELSQQGSDAYPESEAAPERAWWQARALVELQRFNEAQALAREMVARFPDSRFSADARRHLLSHPFGLVPRDR